MSELLCAILAHNDTKFKQVLQTTVNLVSSVFVGFDVFLLTRTNLLVSGGWFCIRLRIFCDVSFIQ